MNRRRIAALLFLGVLAATPALADGNRHGGGHHDGGWSGDHRFHERDLNRWRGGHWHNGHHDGRTGWWWIVGGAWYFYPYRVDPYPDFYLPPLYAAPPGTGSSYRYYCAAPAGYYPYVARCRVEWQPVPVAADPYAAPYVPSAPYAPYAPYPPR